MTDRENRPAALPPKPYPIVCDLPRALPAKEAAIYQKLRSLHCDDKRPGHECQGRLTIDRNGITLSCPRCGDARRVNPASYPEGWPNV